MVSAALEFVGKSSDGYDELVHAVVPDVYMLQFAGRSFALLGRVVSDGNRASNARREENF